MELMAKIAVALWASKMTGIFGNATEGLTTQAMMQGGISLLMTVLIVTIPPIAASYFQGTLGNFMSYSAFGGRDPARDQQTAAAGTPPVTRSTESTRSTEDIKRADSYTGSRNIGEPQTQQQDRIRESTRDKY